MVRILYKKIYSRQRQNKIIIGFILLSIITFSTLNIFQIPLNYTNINDNKRTLNTSDGEIMIETPENITYTDPMAGYYPGTYGFDNDGIGTIPNNWVDGSSTTPHQIQIGGELFDHKNIVEMYDGSSSGNCRIDQNFGSEAFGTIELWGKRGEIDDPISFALTNGYSKAIWFIKEGNNDGWFGMEGTSLLSVDVKNEWFHLRIDFETTTSNYQGLSQYEYKIIVNGIESIHGNFLDNFVPNTLELATGLEPTNYYIYFDAVGYSWDSDYSIGDNLNEGLLLSYTNTTQLEWMGYLIDGLANRTILGNTTISLPSNGLHSIQVFGNTSSGIYHSSDLRYFTVDILSIDLITPENTIYTEPMDGYYPGTYGFENDEIGAIGENISFVDIDTTVSDSSTYIESEKEEHTNVLRLEDTSSSSHCKIEHSLGSAQSNEIIEWYFLNTRPIGPLARGHFQIFEGATELLRLHYSGVSSNTNSLYSYSGGWINIADNVFTEIRWYHIRIELDDASNTFETWIDGVYYGINSYMYDSTIGAEKILISTMGDDSGYSHYYDAISFPNRYINYNIGDNLNEGLLLSFTNTTELEWMGYSLDGLANKTILGNTTIPVPEDGPHTIQVFGNTSLGEYIASNIVQFTIDIDLTPPEIVGINTILEIQQYSYCRINWTLLSPNGGTYQIFINDIFAGMSTFENNDVISITVDTHSSGQFNYTIIAINSHGNPAYHDVIIKVKEKDNPIIPGYDLLALFLISVISICIIGFIKKNKSKTNT